MQTRNPRVLRTAQTRVSGLAKCLGFPGPRVFQNPGFNPYYQSPCALLLSGRICDRDVIVVCILLRIYIFLELQTMSFSKLAAIYINCRDFAVIFAIFCRDFLLSLPTLYAFLVPVHSSLRRYSTSKRQSLKFLLLKPAPSAQDLPVNDCRRSQAMQHHTQRCHHSLQLLRLFIYIGHY